MGLKAANDDVPMVWPVESALELTVAIRHLTEIKDALVKGKHLGDYAVKMQKSLRHIQKAKRSIDKNYTQR
jgi:hypothetical protein